METQMKYIKEISKQIHNNEILHMGDFNARKKELTGDSKTNTYGNIIQRTLLTDFKIIRNKNNITTYEKIVQNKKQQSIIDHFITKKESTKFHGYHVHKQKLGSDHKIISIKMKNKKTKYETQEWGREEIYTYKIVDKHKKKYNNIP